MKYRFKKLIATLGGDVDLGRGVACGSGGVSHHAAGRGRAGSQSSIPKDLEVKLWEI